MEGRRHPGYRLVPGTDQDRIRAVAALPNKGAFDRYAADSASVVRAGLKGLDKNRAVVHSGFSIRSRRVDAVHSATHRPQNRRAIKF